MDFWQDLQDLLVCDKTGKDSSLGGQAVDLYLEVVSNQLPELADGDCRRCAAALVKSQLYRQHAVTIRNRLSLSLKSHDWHDNTYLEILGTVLLHDEGAYAVLQPLIPTLMNIIWMFRITEHRIAKIYLELLFVVILSSTNSEQVLTVSEISTASTTPEFISYLFRVVRDGSMVHNEALPLLLALNDQYMLLSAADHKVENIVYTTLVKNGREFRSVGSAIVVMFNRIGDITLRMLVCKFLWLLFSHPASADFLYTNDLAVLVDVLVRELNDLPHEFEDVRLIYLRVLHELLVNTPLKTSVPNCRSSVTQVLRLVVESGSGETLRLAERCLNVDWLGWSLDRLSTTSDSDANHTTDADHATDHTTDADQVYHTDNTDHATDHTPENIESTTDGWISPLSGPSRESVLPWSPGPPSPPHLPIPAQESPLGSPAESDSEFTFDEADAYVATWQGRRRPPPPPPPPPRHSSSTSSLAVGLIRPPPPPPRRNQFA